MKTRIYDHVVNDRMVTGHWTVRHVPREDRTGPFTADDTDTDDSDAD